MNKRGADDQFGVIVKIILILLVAISLIFFFVNRFGKSENILENYSPGLLQSAVTACTGQISSPVDFCNSLKTVGENTYATCDSSKIVLDGKPGCDGALQLETLRANCKSQISKYPAVISYSGAKVSTVMNKTDCDIKIV